MELVLRYLENALRFRKLAARERDPKVRAELERQAEAYRKMAEDRARERDLPMPDKSVSDAGFLRGNRPLSMRK